MEISTEAPIIVALLPEHFEQVKEIYELGIHTNNATFETKAPEWEEWDAAHIAACRLVALLNGNVVGWAALTPVSGRCIYKGVAEVSVYVHPSYQGKGVGKMLLEKLITLSEQEGYWTLQAGIFRENEASLKLHQNSGFRIVGVRERLGQLQGQWRDVYLLERRSSKVGR